MQNIQRIYKQLNNFINLKSKNCKQKFLLIKIKNCKFEMIFWQLEIS